MVRYSTAQEERDTLVVSMVGEIDAYSAPKVRSGIRSAISDHPDTARLRVDIAGVSFLDSSGVAALVRCRVEAEEHGISLAVANAQQQPAKVLQILGLTDFLAVSAAGDRAAS